MGEWRQSLNGPWKFTTEEVSLSKGDASWDNITVPGNWDTLPAYSTHIGKGWYRRNFTVPAEWKGRHIRLRFDAVYETADVSLNGKPLGSHRGGYTPFEFDVTSLLKDGENTVTVCADNTFRRGAWWAWGGISRDVTLIANNPTRIVWQHIRSQPDLAAGTAKLIVETKIANSGGSRAELTLASAIDGIADPSLGKNVSVDAHSETTVIASTSLPKGRVRLWHFDHPNLYQLTSRIKTGGEWQHEKTDRFGIRKIEVTKNSLLLNGERIRVCGFNRVSDSKSTGNTEPDSLVKLDVDLMKRANANFSRLMHCPQAPNLLDYLDEKGMMIFGEIPVWGEGDPNMQEQNPLTKQWLREMIERDYNHPCIIGWSVGNELKEHKAYVKSMIDYTRKLDPSRLVNYVSFTGLNGDMNTKNDPITFGDLLMHNTYGVDNAKRARVLRKKWPDLPLFFSELGATQIGISPDAVIPGMDTRFAPLGKLPYVIGVSVWTFNDYRSDHKGTPPSGNREWGVVTEDRKPKAAYQQIRELFRPVHSLTVSSRVIRLQPRGKDEIPGFTLRGYTLKWETTSASGAVLESGKIPLPDFKPGDAPWTSSPVGGPSSTGAAGLVVRLMTPTGYDVADCTEP